MDGGTLISELDSGNAITRRYVPGPDVDEPVVWYEGSGTSTRRYYHADERGSVIAVSDSSGNAYAVNSYDEYGFPGAGNTGRFQYTGQPWVPSLGLYHYRARMYSPSLGRFMQTDPIGYGDGMNIYAYVHADPVNFIDPTGECDIGQVRVQDWSPPWTEPPRGGPGGDPGPIPTVTARSHCMQLVNPSSTGTGNPPNLPGPISRPIRPLCTRAHERAAATRSHMPSYVGRNSTYDDIGALRREAQTYHARALEYVGLSLLAGGGGFANRRAFISGAVTRSFAGPVNVGLFAAGLAGAGGHWYYERAARAMEARIAELQLMDENECPRDH